MKWLLHNRGYFSACGQYEVRPDYAAGHFSWRGRHIESDRLIASSADRGFVEQCCERHADSTLAAAVTEASA